MVIYVLSDSYTKTAKDVVLNGSTLNASLQKDNGTYVSANVNFNDHLSRDNGTLVWGKPGIASEVTSLSLRDTTLIIRWRGVMLWGEYQDLPLSVEVDLTNILRNRDGKFVVEMAMAKMMQGIERGYTVEEGHILTALVYDKITGELRRSDLDLNYCLQHDWHEWKPAMAPESIERPDFKHLGEGSLSEIYAQGNMTVSIEQSTLHIRWVHGKYFGETKDSFIPLSQSIRQSPSGRLEWVHDPFEHSDPAWLRTIAKVLDKMPSMDPVEGLTDAAVKLLESATAKLPERDRNWLCNCYVDDGKLIRRGT